MTRLIVPKKQIKNLKLHTTGKIYYIVYIKDARSVSLYPYNQSQILQYVKYTKKINIVKEIANFCDK